MDFLQFKKNKCTIFIIFSTEKSVAQWQLLLNLYAILCLNFKNFDPMQRFLKGNILIFCIVSLEFWLVISIYIIHVFVILFFSLDKDWSFNRNVDFVIRKEIYFYFKGLWNEVLISYRTSFKKNQKGHHPHH